DRYTEYSKLLLKYYLSQGIASGHHVLFASAEEDPINFIKGLPWIADNESDSLDGVADDGKLLEEKMTIAWRYKNMKKFESGIKSSNSNIVTSSVLHHKQIPVGSGLGNNQKLESAFNHVFDLTKLIPQSTIESAQMTLVDVNTWNDNEDPYNRLLSKIHQVIDEKHFRSSVSPPAGVERNAMRIGIHSIASPSWRSKSPHDLFRFFHALRGLLRISCSSAVITIPAHLYDSSLFIRRIEHMSDSVIELESFAGSPSAANSVYSATYHGLFHVYKLPTINSLLSSSAKLSILSGGGGNNLGFKLRRKKFSIETFHLPPEGGVGER
ncbi:398_t:CDS:2, partial [Acaulospora morrowiae]